MSVATLVNALSTEYTDQFLLCEYESESIPADSTSETLIELILPGKSLDPESYKNIPNVTTSGQTYVIEFITFSCSCNSRNFDLHILDRNDINALNTIYEVINYRNQNLLIIDKQNEPFVVRNRDLVLTNKLYLYIENYDVIPTGIIRIELVYIPVQSRRF
jgi:hypothetical protein